MATTAEKARREQEERDAEKARERGDVLGLGDADPDVKLPGNARPSNRRPQCIEVREHATGIGDLSQGPGATGIDMGAGGTGTERRIDPETRRPAQEDGDDT